MIQGTGQHSRPKQAMDEFKETTGLWLSRNRPDLAWQKDYHDHIVRRSEDWRRHAFYILNNPVRADLAVDPYEYPYTGSIGYDLQEMLADLSW